MAESSCSRSRAVWRRIRSWRIINSATQPRPRITVSTTRFCLRRSTDEPDSAVPPDRLGSKNDHAQGCHGHDGGRRPSKK